MDNTSSPSQTATQILPQSSPSSSSSSSSPSLPASQSAAVSHALQQAIPPRPSSGPRTLPDNTPTQQQSSQSSSDKVLSEEDFDNPFTPQPTNRITEQTNKPVQQDSTKVESKEQEKAAKVEPKEEDDNEADNKLELDIKLDEELKTLEQEEKTGDKGKQTRDYSGFKPEHVDAILKHVPNRHFEKVRSELNRLYSLEGENKSLKEKLDKSTLGKLPESYYEHEEAYVLSPRYAELSNELRYDNYETNHWENQIVRIKRGQPWELLRGYSQDGRPIIDKMPALPPGDDGQVRLDIDAEVAVSKYLQAATRQAQEHRAEIGALAKTHQQDYTRSKQGIDQLKQTFFKSFADESKLTPAIKADLQQAREALATTAPAFHKNPLSELVTFAYAALKLQQRQMINMMRMMNNKKVETEDVQKAGPSKSEFSGGSAQGDKVLDEKDFDE